ncbi:MAG: hypothetical protein DCF31_14140 [Alphaproteobacteria bacterium]|nr:MAG: hypothetical protein DCF31_14140 [Alphaproteobacteria bacterium]
MALAAVLIGLAGLLAAYQAFFTRPDTARIAFLATAGAFCFWYWFPALNLLTLRFYGPDERVPTESSVTVAIWLVLAYQMSVIVGLAAVRPLFAPLQNLAVIDGDDRAARWLGFLVLGSAIAFLVARFARDGIGVLVDLAVGLASARDNATYFNRSEDAGTSLLALWDIVNIWIALFVIALMTWRRALLSGPCIAALGAIAFVFLASGTRAVLMQALFIIGMTIAVRGTAAIRPVSRPGRSWLYLIPLVGVAGLAFSAFASRFRESGSSGGLLTIVDTLLVNPDMTRELAFVLDRMPNFPNHTASPFVITPFAFSLPRFLGFDRQMPEHLVAFNGMRGDIDLLFGQGNIFPGIVADFHMVFGPAGPVLMALFVAIHAIGLDRVAQFIPDTTQRGGYVVACIAYMFFSFRNIGGMLFLVIVLGIAVITGLNSAQRWLLPRRSLSPALSMD